MKSNRQSVSEKYLPQEVWLQIVSKSPVRDLVRFKCVCKTWCSIIDYHPNLCLQILVRLPVKTLLRFRCVCRTWCSIIDDPDFAPMHQIAFKNNSDKRSILFFEHYLSFDEDDKPRRASRVGTRTSDTFSVSQKIWAITYPDYSYYRYCNYMDGLLLMGGSQEMTVWNPSIRKSLRLPTLPVRVSRSGPFFLGCEPLTNDYKVVAIVEPYRRQSSDDNDCVLAVYTLKSGCWKIDLGHSFKTFMKITKWWHVSDMVISKGLAHWLGNYYDWRCGDSKAKGYSCIISFDLASETFSCTRLPDDGHDICERIALPFLLGDSLAVFSISRTRSSIWVMEGNGISELWSQEYARDAHFDIYKFFLLRPGIKILYYEEEHKFLILDSEQVRSYDLESHEMVVLGKVRLPQANMDPYVESLLLCKALPEQTLTPFPNYVEVFF